MQTIEGIKLPKLSHGEEALARQFHAENIAVVREFKFHPVRKWRFDFAFPESKVGVEVEGGTFVGGRHTRGLQYEADCQKYNAATLLGWRVLRFTPHMINRGEALRDVMEVLQ